MRQRGKPPFYCPDARCGEREVEPVNVFSRRARMGDWHYWGNESLETAEIGNAA